MKFKVSTIFVLFSFTIVTLNAHDGTLNKSSDSGKKHFTSKVFVDKTLDSSGRSMTCWSCIQGFSSLIFQIRYLKSPEWKVRHRLGFLCPIFRLWGAIKIHDLPDRKVCEKLIDRFAPTIFYILKTRTELSAEAFCGFTMQQLGCNSNSPYLEWTISDLIPKQLPVNKQNTTDTDGGQDRIQRGLKILHLADVHIDLKYQPNTVATCQNSILCCHNDSKPLRTFGFDLPHRILRSGVYGSNKKCDPPLLLLDLTLKHIVHAHPDVQLVYMTGDIVSRNIDSTTKQGNIDVIQKVSKLISQYYPNTTVIPAIGNHESHPVNLFSPPNAPDDINTRWVYNVTWEAWKSWIPQNQKKNFFTGGYYSIEISKEFKILVLNTNLCYGLNLWGMYNVKDPAGQLEWLIKELTIAESKNQVVHILGHVPPSKGVCNKMWSRNYYEIVSRFRSIIKGQFFGHTHRDQLIILNDPAKIGKPISSIFISPSLTAYERNNPAFKIFYAKAHPFLFSNPPTTATTNETSVQKFRNTFEIIDYELYVFDLEEANKTPNESIPWFPLYRATTDYGLKDTKVFDLNAMAHFVNRMASNKTLFDLYYQNSQKLVPRQRKPSIHFSLESEKSLSEYKKILCTLVRPYHQNEKECNRILSLVNKSEHQ